MSLYKDASLVMIPSAYKDGKLYSIRPTDGSGDFTFSRGSNLAATRVDVNGLIEKGRENLLLQSNQFDTTWSLTAASTITGGQAGYDGSNNAWLLNDSGQSPAYAVYQIFNTSGVKTLSIYAKAASTSQLEIDFFDSPSRYLRVELSDGSIHDAQNLIDYKVENAGNGWWRCSLTANTNSTSYVRFGCNGAGSIYVQDSQVEAGLVATDYIETGASTAQAGILEDMPRLDYSGSCPALLLEPQRTNRFAHSEYSGGFSSGSAITITDNATTSPEGLQNAIKITKSANGYAYFRGSIPADTGTLSVFAKKGNYRYIGLRNNQVAGNDHSVFDFDTETFVNVASGQTCTYEDYGDGWYRLSAYQPTNESSGYVGIALSDENGAELVGSSIADGSHFYIYGLQLESASYPTSYIPTYGSSVTRSDDSCLATSVSDVIGQTQGTMFIDFVFNGNPTSVDYSFMILGAIGSNYITIGGYNKSLYARVFNNTMQGTINALQMVVGTRYKIAIGYAENDVVMYVNGVNEGSDTSVSIPALSQIGFTRPSFVHSADVNQSVVFPTRLTNAELAALTTI